MTTTNSTTEDSTDTEPTSNNSEFDFDTEAVSDTDLTTFQTNILFVLCGCMEGRYDGRAPSGAMGLAIKEILETEEWYGEKVSHGRLYPNLGTLIDKGLVAKSKLDKRTNHYEITDDGTTIIAEQLQRNIACLKGETPGDGGE
jgi:hypothetical protein